MSTISKIASFAVLDLETATLPDYNFNKANITEIAIHGFSAKEIRNAKTCDNPRVNHKLTLLFNPQMMIHPKSEEITGLNNYMLEGESSFDANAANGIVSFLSHLRQPVCLVAHNGDKFDFPILKHSFDKVGVKLSSGILCIDTLTAIKELDRLSEEQQVIPFSQEDNGLIPLADVETPAVVTVLDTEEEEEKPTDWKKLNETTPKRPPNLNLLTAMRKRKKPIDAEGETTQPVPNIKSRRSLFKLSNEVNNIPNQAGKYKLESIYRRLFDEAPEIAHHAEGDVVSLKKVMLHYGKSFVEYAEANAKLFEDVKKVGAR